MKVLLPFLSAVILTGQCEASSASQPVPGDSWIYQSNYRDTLTGKETKTIKHVEVDGLNALGKPHFSGSITFGMHSDTCLFDVFVGAEIWGEVPCADPLPVGKTWYAGPLESFQGPKQWFTVIGAEKTEAGGKEYQATIITTVGPLPWTAGYRRSKFWYVPEIKGMIKVVHEGLDKNGLVGVEESFTLLSFALTSDDRR